MTRNDAIAQILTSNGKIFTCEFVKRTDGTLRKMNCRLGVKKHLKGGTVLYDREKAQLICVFDLEKSAYRSISVDTLVSLTFAGQRKEVV